MDIGINDKMEGPIGFKSRFLGDHKTSFKCTLLSLAETLLQIVSWCKSETQLGAVMRSRGRYSSRSFWVWILSTFNAQLKINTFARTIFTIFGHSTQFLHLYLQICIITIYFMYKIVYNDNIGEWRGHCFQVKKMDWD